MRSPPSPFSGLATTRRDLLGLLGAGVGSIAGCGGPDAAVERGGAPTPPDEGPVRPTQTPMPTPFVREPDASIAYTHPAADGTRRVGGTGPFPDADPVDVAVGATPTWLVGLAADGRTHWVATDADGRAHRFAVEGGAVVQGPIVGSRLPPGAPPVLVGTDDGGVRVLVAPPGASPTTHPIAVSGRLVAIGRDGDLIVHGAGRARRLAVDALTDARPIDDGSGRVAFLAGPTTRYDHGVLGDAVEAGRVTVASIGADGAPAEAGRLAVPAPAVIEGIAPIWADLTGSGDRDVVVTESDASSGARLVAFVDGTGRTIRGRPVGGGFRWRHQLAVAPFGPDGGTELAVVRTPHIGGVVEFHRPEGDALAVTARLEGYSSHAIGSRNLDGGLAGDLDGDGTALLVPTQDRDGLGAVRRTTDGAEEAWRVPVGGRLATNLAGVPVGGGRFAVGVGREDGTVRLWVP